MGEVEETRKKKKERRERDTKRPRDGASRIAFILYEEKISIPPAKPSPLCLTERGYLLKEVMPALAGDL